VKRSTFAAGSIDLKLWRKTLAPWAGSWDKYIPRTIIRFAGRSLCKRGYLVVAKMSWAFMDQASAPTANATASCRLTVHEVQWARCTS
jgi:hypothetical protein